MAETALGIVVDKLIPLLRDEVTLLRGVPVQVKIIKDEPAFIQSYLKDADEKAEMADTRCQAKERVKQTREVAYRMEDVVDEYLFQEAKRRQRRAGSGSVGVLNFHICKICFLLRTSIPRHDITSEIGDIKQSIVRLNQAGQALGFNPSADPAEARRSRRDIRLGAHFIREDQLVGADHTRDLLADWLLGEERRRTVISNNPPSSLICPIKNWISLY